MRSIYEVNLSLYDLVTSHRIAKSEASDGFSPPPITFAPIPPGADLDPVP